MNWEAIGAIGEVGGFVAVLATLVYLTLQIKQSNVQTRILLENSWPQHSMALWRDVMTNSNLAELLNQALVEKGELNATQIIQLRTWVQHELMTYQQMISLAKLANEKTDYRLQVEQSLRRLAANSGLVRKFILEESHLVGEELREIVGRVCDERA